MYTIQELFEHCEASYTYDSGVLYSKKYNRPVGSVNPTNGYLILNTYLGSKDRHWRVPVHRVIFLMHYKSLPAQIDHINRIKTDNRIENLRAATQTEQNCNKDKTKANTSGYKGVMVVGPNKFEARIQYQRKLYHLGTFSSAESAYAAYCKKASELHGEFSSETVSHRMPSTPVTFECVYCPHVRVKGQQLWLSLI